jgi:hypothetical protein
MDNEVQACYTRPELMAAAATFMYATYGKPSESEDRDQWHARYGMLIDFVTQLWDRTIP